MGVTLTGHSHQSLLCHTTCPLATARIAADGNCFFQSVSLAVTCRVIGVSWRTASANHSVHDTQINKSNAILPWIPRWRLYGKLYMKWSRMQTTLGASAMELEVISTVFLLNTSIYMYIYIIIYICQMWISIQMAQAKCGEAFKWLRHSPQETKSGLHQDEGIYTCTCNFNKHFVTVKKMQHQCVSVCVAFVTCSFLMHQIMNSNI